MKKTFLILALCLIAATGVSRADCASSDTLGYINNITTYGSKWLGADDGGIVVTGSSMPSTIVRFKMEAGDVSLESTLTQLFFIEAHGIHPRIYYTLAIPGCSTSCEAYICAINYTAPAP